MASLSPMMQQYFAPIVDSEFTASLEDKQAELMQADGQVAALQAAQAEVARLLASARAEAQQLPLAADN